MPTPPPKLEASDERHPSHDRRYASLAPEQLPATECLADVVERMLPYWYDAIVPDLRNGSTTLVVAHGNSLRALVMHLDGVSEEAISDLNIPTGMPRLYEFDSNLEVVEARYLGDPVAVAAAAVRPWPSRLDDDPVSDQGVRGRAMDCGSARSWPYFPSA